MELSTFTTGLVAISVMLASYGLVAIIGHAIGLKAWRTHPPIVIPATVMVITFLIIGITYLIGFMVEVGLGLG